MATAPRSARRPPGAGVKLSFNDPVVRAIFWQIVIVGAVGLVVWWLVGNTVRNLEARRIASGFDYFWREAGLPIGEAMIEYQPSDNYFRALVVGVLNTLRIAVVSIVLATILGTLIGVARLSRNWLVAKLASVYVETLRNLPLLLQLLFWYSVLQSLPPPREALNPLPHVYLFVRGLQMPWPQWTPELGTVLAVMGIGIVASFLVRGWAKRRQMLTGEQFPIGWTAVGLVVALPLAVFVMQGANLPLDVPTLGRFNITGGILITPEFTALLIGLVTYTAAFIAEIVRSGIQAVSHGQTEAAAALGLKRGQALRLVILPQALRVIIPPMTSQYLNVTKNSSLAVAIGYPDIVSIANTILNQTGQAIEGIGTIMAVYLTVSLSISAFMNWYNRRIALRER
ncbi:MAG: amino acid ABC transporter permease [Alphaproteobacteria bacterium]|nr:amino acid ABC transporter permease [Alphaproteobacteria bacterium]